MGINHRGASTLSLTAVVDRAHPIGARARVEEQGLADQPLAHAAARGAVVCEALPALPRALRGGGVEERDAEGSHEQHFDKARERPHPGNHGQKQGVKARGEGLRGAGGGVVAEDGLSLAVPALCPRKILFHTICFVDTS